MFFAEVGIVAKKVAWRNPFAVWPISQLSRSNCQNVRASLRAYILARFVFLKIHSQQSRLHSFARVTAASRDCLIGCAF